MAATTTTNNNSNGDFSSLHTRERMPVSASSSTPSLPSFVELMASLGLQDEHSANALIRGASDEKSASTAPANDNHQELLNGAHVQTLDDGQTQHQQHQVEPRATNYRDSTVSITSLGLATPSLESQNPLSLGTPLSSAPLLTPLNSPNAHRDRPNASVHGKKRYSPYGLSPPNINEYRDIYSRRGSVPGTTTEIDDALKEQRQIHHRSAPLQPSGHLQFSQIESAPRLQRRTDEDGDEEMRDAEEVAATSETSPSSYISKEKETHCAGQPNVLFSRQRISSRGTLGARTKSQTNLRGTSVNQTPFPSHKSGVPSISRGYGTSEGGKDKSPYSSLGRRSARDIVNANAIQNTTAIIDLGMDNDVDVDNNAPVASISSLMRRSHPATSSTATATTTAGGGVATIPEAPEASSSNANAGSAVRSHHLSLHNRSRGILSTPPSAPPTKTTFGFTPGVSISGTSISAARRARHARSSSARSVQEMMREQKNPSVFQSFHPLAEDVPPVPPMPPMTTVPSISSISSISKQASKKRISGNNSDSSDPGRVLASDSFLPLDDTSRSFAHRRRARRQHLKNSPPPPLMLLPTLPNTFSIKTIIGVPPGAADGKDGESGDGVKKAAMLGPGYVSRREPHSPDARSSWRTRRTTPPTSSLAAPPVGVMES